MTTPALCALSGCSIFIASSTTIRSPSATLSPSATATFTIVPCIGDVSASPLAAGRAAFLPRSARCGAAPRGGWCGRDRRAGRQRHLDALAADLDDHGLARRPASRRAAAARVERRHAAGPLGLDPAGVHRERLGRERSDRARSGGGTAARSPCRRRPSRRATGGRARCASPRVSPTTITLASSESKLPPMTLPDSMPVSTRTPGPDGRRSVGHHAGRRQEAAARVLAVDAELDRVPARCRILGDAQRLAVGDPELLADQVDAGRLLGHRVLDLQPGVDLEERDRAVLADEVLDRAGAVVAGLPADRLRGRVDLARAARR